MSAAHVGEMHSWLNSGEVRAVAHQQFLRFCGRLFSCTKQSVVNVLAPVEAIYPGEIVVMRADIVAVEL
jgi:hypothetical protein